MAVNVCSAHDRCEQEKMRDRCTARCPVHRRTHTSRSRRHRLHGLQQRREGFSRLLLSRAGRGTLDHWSDFFSPRGIAFPRTNERVVGVFAHGVRHRDGSREMVIRERVVALHSRNPYAHARVVFGWPVTSRPTASWILGPEVRDW